MASLTDEGVRRLLDAANFAVISTVNRDGSVHSTVAWVDIADGRLAANSAVGRHWPSNLERDPRLTVAVFDQGNPYDYVEIRGTATMTTEGADAHIDRLARKYLGADSYPMRQPGEQRISIFIDPERVRHRKQ